jgi:hypothetical protein
MCFNVQSGPGGQPGGKAFILFLSLAMLSAPDGMAQLCLVNQGQSAYRIVVPSNVIPSERYAAEELQGYLEKISGAKLPIALDAVPAVTREILVGDNSHLQKLGLNLALQDLGPEGFVLRTKGDRLIIAGGKPRGTLYGVYTLLEEQLGVRWFTPELEAAPRTNSVWLPSLDQTNQPTFEYREVYWTEMTRSPDFAARHRLNGEHYALQAKHGGRPVVYFPFVHSLDSLIPQTLFKEHPDYFPLIDGQRVGGYVQRCLSNPDVEKLAIRTVREWIAQHPDATIVSISQNDTGKWCQCERCKALDEAEGSLSASLIRFVNAISQELEPDHPQIRFDTLAYQYSRRPPKTLRPRRNVIVRLCSIECCFAHPLESCSSSENQRFRKDIAAWEPIAPSLYIWDYTPNFAHYEQPFPNFAVLQPNIRFFQRRGVKGIFEQGNSSPGGFGEMGPLRAYLLAELLWNPEANVQRLTQEFLRAYFGQAATEMRAYLTLLNEQVRNPDVHAHIYDPPTAAYLNEAFLNAAESFLAKAEQVAENGQIKFRVQVAHLPVWYVGLAANRVTGQPRAELLKQFLEISRKAGITNISEGQGLDEWASNTGAK